MGSEIVYCSVCGDRILERDFQKGRAVTILKKNYCSGCSAEALKQQAPKEESLPEIVPKKSRTQRIPRAEEPRKTRLISVPFMVAIGIGIVAVLLLLVVLFRKG